MRVRPAWNHAARKASNKDKILFGEIACDKNGASLCKYLDVSLDDLPTIRVNFLFHFGCFCLCCFGRHGGFHREDEY